ncbi:MAG: hypothetical protein LLG15_01740 [Betaproteobacteria bacterium]|nr:hypothetical protein [Betaproteobacteria bacterium]
MRAFLVEITTVAVVMADDADHAYLVVEDLRRDICGEDDNPSISVGDAELTLTSLPNGWDGRCIPFGGDGNTTLAELMKPVA